MDTEKTHTEETNGQTPNDPLSQNTSNQTNGYTSPPPKITMTEPNGHQSTDKGDDVEDQVFEDDPRNTQCGVGGWRPSWLQRFSNMYSFTLVLSMVSVFGSMNFSYYTAVITEIERSFGLSSSMTGFIKNIDNIGYMLTVILLSHIFRYANKPRIFAIFTLLTAGSIFLFGTPYFIYGYNNEGEQPPETDNSSEYLNSSMYEVCDGVDESIGENGCSFRSTLTPFNKGAFAIFIVSEILQGIGQSPKMSLTLTFLDDNAKQSSPKYFGFMFGMRAFAPVLGFLLGAWTSSIYVDLSDPGISQKDPRWVGAWWLGFVICAACSVIWVIPMALFPPRITGGKQLPLEKDEKPIKSQGVSSLPVSLARIVKNPLIMLILLGTCFNVYLMGFATFTPKYLQNHFTLSAKSANILTGLVGCFTYSIGPIVSGRVTARMNISASSVLKLVVVIHVICIIGFGSMMFMTCPKAQFAGNIDKDNRQLNASCNANCACDPYVYQPVCGSDGLNHFSSCYAGCSEQVTLDDGGTLFTNCSCIEGGNGTATLGMCYNECLMTVPYLVVKGISMFASSMSFVPIMTTITRAVDSKDKALALAFFGFVLQFIAFPAPMVFGWFVDSACIVQQESCTRKGACLMYDIDTFRLRLHGGAVLLKALALGPFIIAYIVARNMDRRRKKAEQKDLKNAEELKDLISNKETNGDAKQNGDVKEYIANNNSPEQ